MNTERGYAIEFPGHGTFTPEGRTGEITDTEAHNAALEAEELKVWATQPERWQVYVPMAGFAGKPQEAQVGWSVTTWTSYAIGYITYARTFLHNFGSRMTCIRFKGTNGATYAGRFGSDWSQLCRVRKVRS